MTFLLATFAFFVLTGVLQQVRLRRELRERLLRDAKRRIRSALGSGEIDACTFVTSIKTHGSTAAPQGKRKLEKKLIAVSRRRGTVYFGTLHIDLEMRKATFAARKILLRNIISIDIIEDGENKTVHLSSADRSGRMLGPAGIVLHRESRPDERRRVRNIYFKFIMRNVAAPVAEVHFLERTLRQRSRHLAGMSRHIERWYAIFQILLRDSDTVGGTAHRPPASCGGAPAGEKE